MKLSLACGQNKPKGFKGVDIAPGKNVDYVQDLMDFPWQFKDSSVDEIECSHFIEHIPHGNGFYDPFFSFFDEVYRILKPAKFSPDNPNIPISGFATFTAPYYSSMRAWQDPTHMRAISDATLLYLDANWRKINKLDHYPIKADFFYYASYNINARLNGRNQEYIQNAIATQINAVDDLVFTVWKK
jgi:hypothetical protein